MGETEPDTSKTTYHHGDLATALVSAGLELTRSGGPAALSLREATRRAGVSPNAAYRHFANRDALLAAVSEEIATAMARRMVAAGTFDSATGIELLRAVGLGYIEFAIDEPGWFAVAFFGASDSVAVGHSVGDAPPYRALVHALDRMVIDGDLAASARVDAEWPCWSMVHGFAELALHGPLRGCERGALREHARRSVDAAIAGVVGTDAASVRESLS